MTEYVIALDIGTSGLRCQAIDLETRETVATAITQRHPIPGMNVIDHVNFAIKSGEDVANGLIIGCINQLLGKLGIDLSKVKRLAVCGNPFQLSLFQNIEIRDLAYAGKNMLRELGVVSPPRDGAVLKAGEMGIKGMPADAEVIIPPAVRHEIGADAMAMLMITGVLDSKEPCVVADYGTNAEMALICGDGRIITGSAAAGPAMEGQEIERGMLAAPGAISDINITADGWKCEVLNDKMIGVQSDTVNPKDGTVVKSEPQALRAVGITGTGVIASIYDGLKTGMVSPPKVLSADGKLHLQDGINITSHDIDEAGKAIGALRAGFLTLLHEAGMWTSDVDLAYMSGASGLYVDAKKAMGVGMVVPGVSRIIQFGNTSIEMARRIAMGDLDMDAMRAFAKKLRAEHCMFATSETFKNIYSVEYSLWCGGMPASEYNNMLDLYNLPPLTEPKHELDVKRVSMTDLPDTDKCPVQIVESGTFLTGVIEGCIYCRKCERECPEKALKMVRGEDGRTVAHCSSDRCAGTACRRCERVCPKEVLHMDELKVEE